jgi:hypothetical protein
MFGPNLTFDTWKCLLQKDCEQNQKLQAFNSLGPNTLRIFWERGVDPTVEALIADGTAPRAKSA